MSTQSEKIGSELSEEDYERAKEMIKQFIDDQNSGRTYAEMFMAATSYTMGLFKSRGSIPVSLLEYANKASMDKALERWHK